MEIIMEFTLISEKAYGTVDYVILANEINCRIQSLAAVYTVKLIICLRQTISLTSITEERI